MNLNKELYTTYLTWSEFYEKNNNIEDIKFNLTWKKMFDKIFNDDRFEKLKNKLKDLILNKNEKKLYPKPELLFNAFNITSFSDLKVVILGQDPYFNCEYHDRKISPQAMGLSFSVPKDIKIPSSLNNIYANMIKYKNLKYKPSHGNLEFWAYQGCLLLNTSLTVIDGQKNCHSTDWRWITNDIIKYISDKKDYVIFVLWGNDALKKLELIDIKKHDVIISSHPSGLSVNKKLKQYSEFANLDHFGEINNLLEKNNFEKIFWQI